MLRLNAKDRPVVFNPIQITAVALGDPSTGARTLVFVVGDRHGPWEVVEEFEEVVRRWDEALNGALLPSTPAPPEVEKPKPPVKQAQPEAPACPKCGCITVLLDGLYSCLNCGFGSRAQV